jgi:hypothetical protein
MLGAWSVCYKRSNGFFVQFRHSSVCLLVWFMLAVAVCYSGVRFYIIFIIPDSLTLALTVTIYSVGCV